MSETSVSVNASAKPSVMVWGLAAVIGAGAVCGLLGAILGGLLGVLLPGYYRSVFSGGESPSFDPVAVGIGLGFSQGVLFGGIIGVAVFALYLHHRRSQVKK